MDDSASQHSEFSVYLLPGSFALLNLIACLFALLTASFDLSLFNNSWNIIYYFSEGFKTQHVYIVRIAYFYRKTTIDFNKTSVVLQFAEVNDFFKVNIRIPPKFFGQNRHNIFHSDYAIIKFLFIRDSEFRNFNKVSITHDYQGEFNVSMIGIQSANSNDGFICCVEKCIQPMTIEEMEKNQSFIIMPQSNMELEGEFSISEGISVHDIVSPTYLLINVICYKCATAMLDYYANLANQTKQPYLFSVSKANIFGITYFFFIFGMFAIIYVLTKHRLDGRPRKRGNKIFNLYIFLCVVIGIGFGIRTVYTLDPEYVKYNIRDASLYHQFIFYWAVSVLYSIAIVVFFGVPFFLVYHVLISLLFGKYKFKT